MEIEKNKDIIISPIDKRTYHVFTLPNQIQALLISDPGLSFSINKHNP